MLPTKFQFIWPSGFRGEKLKSANQKQKLTGMPCLLANWKEMSNLHRGPPVDATYKVSVHLAKKPLGQMNRNLVGSILGRSSIKIAHLFPMR
jgi:hypothetical protein